MMYRCNMNHITWYYVYINNNNVNVLYGWLFDCENRLLSISTIVAIVASLVHL